jgi:iron complex transport system substrate-binding protein
VRKVGALLAVALLVAAALAVVGASAQEITRKVTDSAGRRVEIPRKVIRVLAAGPPASILLYTLAPERMIGWVRAPRPAEKAFLIESVCELPEYGRLTGRGSTANIENIIRFKPDLIIDVGSVGPTYVSLADNVQEQTKIPYVLPDGSLAKTPEIYRLLGDWLGVKDNVERLAQYADETLNALGKRIAAIPGRSDPRSTMPVASTGWRPASAARSTWRCWSASAPSTWPPRRARAASPRCPSSRCWPGTRR